MAFRRRRFRRKYGRSRKRFSRFSRSRVARSRRANGRRYFKLRTALDCLSDAGGSIHFTWSLTAISTNLVNINGAGPSNSLEEVSSIGALFDQYRVHAIKIAYFPQLPNDTSTVTGFFPMYTVVDRDTPNTSPPITSIAVAVQYGSLKVYNMYRPWKRYIKVGKYAQSGNPLGTMDLANIPNYGCLDMYGTGFDISQTYGKFVITYYVSCTQRR